MVGVEVFISHRSRFWMSAGNGVTKANEIGLVMIPFSDVDVLVNPL